MVISNDGVFGGNKSDDELLRALAMAPAALVPSTGVTVVVSLAGVSHCSSVVNSVCLHVANPLAAAALPVGAAPTSAVAPPGRAALPGVTGVVAVAAALSAVSFLSTGLVNETAKLAVGQPTSPTLVTPQKAVAFAGNKVSSGPHQTAVTPCARKAMPSGKGGQSSDRSPKAKAKPCLTCQAGAKPTAMEALSGDTAPAVATAFSG